MSNELIKLLKFWLPISSFITPQENSLIVVVIKHMAYTRYLLFYLQLLSINTCTY